MISPSRALAASNCRKQKLTINNTLSGVSTISHELLAPIGGHREHAFHQPAFVLSAIDQ